MALLELRHVSKTYRQGGLWGSRRLVHAVRDASFALEAGECLAVVGASGSGKSTLGRLALGLEKPDSGTLLFAGKLFFSLHGPEKKDARRRVQAVFQNSHGAVNPRFTARDIVGEPLRNFFGLRGEELTAKAAALLERVGIGADELGKLPHQFSGGELQRICLARALAPQPDIIVLDEAVSSLDMVNQSRIIGMLESIREHEKTALVFISHDMRLVSRLADAMLVMEHGEIVHRSGGLRSGGSAGRHPVLEQLAAAVLPELPA